jgi:hypothetical protein
MDIPPSMVEFVRNVGRPGRPQFLELADPCDSGVLVRDRGVDLGTRSHRRYYFAGDEGGVPVFREA